MILFEKYSQTYLIAIRIIGFLFIVWGIFFLQDAAFIFITILIAVIFWNYPFTTGLGEDVIVYHQKGTLSSKTQKISDIRNYQVSDNEEFIKITFNVRNQFQIEMTFDKDDKEKIEQLLQEN